MRNPRVAVGAPVVAEKVKYYVLAIKPKALLLAAAGPDWRRGPVVAQAEAWRLVWDDRAGVFRGPVAPIVQVELPLGEPART